MNKRPIVHIPVPAILDTRWFICMPPKGGPGIVYTKPARSSRMAWKLAAIAMIGGSAFVASPNRNELVDREIHRLRRLGYRARRCHIVVAT